MYDGLFVILFLSYVVVAIYVEKWTALSTLAQKGAIPDVISRYPELLFFVNSLFLVASLTASFYTVHISRYVSIPLVFIAFLSVVSIGRRFAYKKYNAFNQENSTYKKFHDKIVENKRVIKKRKFKDGTPIK